MGQGHWRLCEGVELYFREINLAAGWRERLERERGQEAIAVI